MHRNLRLPPQVSFIFSFLPVGTWRRIGWLLGALLYGLTIAGLCVSCSKPVYYADDKAQFKRDSYECSRDSRTYGGGSGLVGALLIIGAQQQAQSLYNQCMESKGYVRQ